MNALDSSGNLVAACTTIAKADFNPKGFAVSQCGTGVTANAMELIYVTTSFDEIYWLAKTAILGQNNQFILDACQSSEINLTQPLDTVNVSLIDPTPLEFRLDFYDTGTEDLVNGGSPNESCGAFSVV